MQILRHSKIAVTMQVYAEVVSASTIQQNAQLDFEISATDMGVLDAMRDTDKHEDTVEFRWK